MLFHRGPIVGIALLSVAACGTREEPRHTAPVQLPGTAVAVRETTVTSTFDATGVAAPIQQATLSTKLMGTVTAVLAREGDRVGIGQSLLHVDARDLAAKSAQVAASLTEAEAIRQDARTQARRIRALYADSAATRVQLDAVETALARAEAGVRTAHAAEDELDAVRGYATITAPFSGTVVKRFVDPGAFASPGAPLLTVQDASKLRISVSAAPAAVRAVHRGQTILATIERHPVQAIVEGVVPAGGNLYTINAIVTNTGARFLAGSAATIAVPLGTRTAIVIPTAAVTRDGELAAVILRTSNGDERRWVRLGESAGNVVTVDAGLHAGDIVVVPNVTHAARTPIETTTAGER